MDFALTEDQEELRKVARAYLEDRCPPSVVREIERGTEGYLPAMWSEMADMGWVGLALPGGGGDLSDLAIVFEELGRAVCPTPMFSTVALAGLTLAGCDRLPPGLAEGEVLVGTALADVPEGAVDAEVQGSTACVSGVVPFAYDVEGADLLLVAAGPVLVLCGRDQSGIEVEELEAISNDRLYRLRLDRVDGEVVGQTAELLPAALTRATALRVAEMVGVMGRALEMAAEYARNRVQFGQPLGAFQAVQHRLADMLIDVEGARLVASRAAWAIAQGSAGEREVAVAKAWVSDAGQRVAFGAQQVHGGVGVDLDYDLQFYFRRAKALELELGSAPQHRARLATAIGLG